MSSPLKNKYAVVTGASSGIGRAIALALAEQGMHLRLLGRKLNTLRQTQLDALQFTNSVEIATVDFRHMDELTLLIEELSAAPQIDALIHSAGSFAMGDIASMSIDDINDQMQSNYMAPLLLTRAVLPQLKANQGQIVFINSSAAINPGAKTAVYSASKAALKALADSLRQEVSPHGVRVTSIFPGRTATPMQAAILKQEGHAYQPEQLIQPEDVASTVVQALSLARTAEVTDIHMRPFKK